MPYGEIILSSPSHGDFDMVCSAAFLLLWGRNAPSRLVTSSFRYSPKTLQDAHQKSQCRLVRTQMVNRAVGGQKNPNDGAPHAAKHRANSGRQGCSTNIQTEALR
jgi:hypothetical protein